jgi:hypothetical protein
MRTKQMNEKIISDLALASYLSASGYKILSTHPINGRKTGFHFESSEKLEQAVLAYFNRAARVCPLTLFETYRNLKALIVQT